MSSFRRGAAGAGSGLDHLKVEVSSSRLGGPAAGFGFRILGFVLWILDHRTWS